MPEMTGIDVLNEVTIVQEDQDLIVMTAYASVDTAIEAMKHGAVDYITKPFKVDRNKAGHREDASVARRLVKENTTLKKQLQGDNSFDNFIGISETVVQLKRTGHAGSPAPTRPCSYEASPAPVRTLSPRPFIITHPVAAVPS